MWNRRQLLKASLAAPLAPLLPGCRSAPPAPPAWDRAAYRRPAQSRVAVLAASSYQQPLDRILLDGLRLFEGDLWGGNLAGKTVVLKPNLVEYDPKGVINTDPAVVAAALEAFRRLGAAQVLVAEGPGHRRDTEYLLTASGLYAVLKEHQAAFVDLNSDDVRPLRPASRFTRLNELYLPETVLRADLLVSMPKMKTHHWVGVTLAMKNLFGILPGAIYGWPKNLLHWAGIGNSIIDINSTVPARQFAIVDGIVGMEGNGPLQGDAKPCGVLVLGPDLVAVDATAARLMKIDPGRVEYLAQAGQFLGNLSEQAITQIGERIDRHQQDFRVLDSFRPLKVAG